MNIRKHNTIFRLGVIAKVGLLILTLFCACRHISTMRVLAIEPQTGTSGTCTWNIDTDGNMVIKPTSGDECTLANSTAASSMSYDPYRSSITTIRFEGKVYANAGAAYLFYNMTDLTDIDLANFDTSLVTNMAYMFSGVSSLTDLDLSNFDTSKVASMAYMFNGASSLTNLDLSTFNTSQVTSMAYMFGGTSGLASLDLSNFDTSRVTNMYAMFYNTSSLTSLDLSNFDTSNVTTMYAMFYNTSSLTGLDLSDFDTSQVTNMAYMFSGASGLTDLDLSNFDTSQVTNMAYMFNGASSLTNLDLSTFNTSQVTSMAYMFSGASGLTDLDLSNFDTSQVTNMASMFSGASGLTDLDLSNFDTSQVTNMTYMFNNAKGLTSLDLSNFDTSQVTNMAYMFYGAKGLTSLDLSNFDTSQVTNMNSMFASLGSLTYLNIVSFDTTNVTNAGSLFNAAANLREVVLGPETYLKGETFGRGLWRNKDNGALYRGVEIEQGPGDFVRVSNISDDMSVPYTVDYKINKIPQIDEFTTTNPEIFSTDGQSVMAALPLEKVSEYSVPGTVELLFKGVVSDKYGNTYDLKMTYENIKLYDLDRLRDNPDIIYTRILKLDGGDIKQAIQLNAFTCHDYDCVTNVNGQGNVSRSYDISFNILKDGSPVQGSYLFSAYDLDGSSYRDRGSPYDTADGQGYGNYSEGINLGEGFDLDTVILSQNTILQKIGENRYTGTRKDNVTEKSEFVVKADANEAKFTWTTGGAMNTTLFGYYQPTIVDVAKKDPFGNFVAGATLTVSQDGEIRQTWTSAFKPERLWLNPGVYYLKEVSAPEGYEKSDEEIEMIVDTNSVLINSESTNLVTIINQKTTKPDEKPDEEPDEEPKDEFPVPDTGVNTAESGAHAYNMDIIILVAFSVSTASFVMIRRYCRK